MVDIPRFIEPERRHCNICDFFGFVPRPDGSWAFCYFKGRHFPDDIKAGDHVCLNLSVNGRDIFKNE